MKAGRSSFEDLLSTLFQAHPWHSASPGASAPDAVEAFIEIVPTDVVKYELDKRSGHLRVDRPQRFSSMCPTLYGFIPQSYCGENIAELCSLRSGLKRVKGDGDPLDICVITERDIAHGNIFVRAIPIGGLRMIDHGQADDKIIAVLADDIAYGQIRDIDGCPEGLVTRLKHYFLSYKQPPEERGSRRRVVRIDCIYGRIEALEVIRRAFLDYRQKFGSAESRLAELKRMLTETLCHEPAPGRRWQSQEIHNQRRRASKQ